jgi:hypothetical protein
MTDFHDIPEDLRERFDDYLDDRLDDAGLAALEARLREDAEARRGFVRYCRLDTDLFLETRARQASARALEMLGPRPPSVPLRRSWRWLAVAAMALIAIGWTLWGQMSDRAASQEVAWLVNAQNCRWADDEAPTGGMRAGSVLRVERGLVEIQFRRGARVVLEGPAKLELLSDNSARLLAGKLAARVPESAHGFEVLSPEGKVIDHGTEFGVAVGEDGAADVVVFEGRVEAKAAGGTLDLRADQIGHIDRTGVNPSKQAGHFVRTLAVPTANTHTVDFRRVVNASLRDKNGSGIGLTHRLPGTGYGLTDNDPNLVLNPDEGVLRLTTTNNDINRQVGLSLGEYLGFRLADLGFTGDEDFSITATLPSIPSLERVGQFGLFAGTKSDRNIRGGLISKKPRPMTPGAPVEEEAKYTLFLVNNNGGRDTDSHFLDLFSTGDDVHVTLARRSRKFALTVENRRTGGTSTLTIRHPDFLDGERDMFVGFFGANTQSDVRKTLVVKEMSATVWKAGR